MLHKTKGDQERRQKKILWDLGKPGWRKTQVVAKHWLGISGIPELGSSPDSHFHRNSEMEYLSFSGLKSVSREFFPFTDTKIGNL